MALQETDDDYQYMLELMIVGRMAIDKKIIWAGK